MKRKHCPKARLWDFFWTFIMGENIIMAEKVYTIIDAAGIHARPATALVNIANKFTSDVALEYKGRTVNLKSIMGVMSLGVAKGTDVKVTATGSDDAAVIDAITEVMLKNRLINE